MKSLMTRFAGFSAVPMIAFIAPLFLLPIIPRLFGGAAWSALGVAQALGTFAAVFASFGWNISGGARVALSRDDATQRQLLGDAFWGRLLLVIVMGGAIGALAAALVPAQYELFAFLLTMATTAGATTVSWYAVGIGKPRVMIAYETVPLALAVALTAILLLWTRELLWYPIMILAGALAGPLLLNVKLFGNPLPPFSWARVKRDYRSNWRFAGAEIAGVSYTSAPVPLTQALIGSAGAALATSADKFYRVALFAITVLSNTLQKWVLEVDYAQGRIRRHLVTLGAHAILGVVGGAALTLLGPFFSRLFFGAEFTPGWPVFLGFALNFAATSMTFPLIRNILIPSGRNATVFRAYLAAALLGIPLMVLGARWGVAGIMFGLAACELIVMIITGFVSARVLRAESSIEAHASRSEEQP